MLTAPLATREEYRAALSSASDRTALAEVVGDAGLLTDPDNYAQTVECLNRVLEDEELRAGLIQKGYANVKRFDWDSRIAAYWEELSR